MKYTIMRGVKRVGFQRAFSTLFFTLSIMAYHQSNAQTDFDKKVNSLVKGTIPQIKAYELADKLKESRDLVILDTRTAEEFEVSKINGANFIDYDHFHKKMVKHIPLDQEIIVYCSVGYRSEKIGEKLRELGYTNVLNLYGGIFDWKNTDHGVVNPQGAETDSVHTYNKNWSKWLYKGVKVYE